MITVFVWSYPCVQFLDVFLDFLLSHSRNVIFRLKKRYPYSTFMDLPVRRIEERGCPVDLHHCSIFGCLYGLTPESFQECYIPSEKRYPYSTFMDLPVRRIEELNSQWSYIVVLLLTTFMVKVNRVLEVFIASCYFEKTSS